MGGWKSISGTGRPQSSRSEKKEWLKGRSLMTCGVSIEFVSMRGAAVGRRRRLAVRAGRGGERRGGMAVVRDGGGRWKRKKGGGGQLGVADGDGDAMGGERTGM